MQCMKEVFRESCYVLCKNVTRQMLSLREISQSMHVQVCAGHCDTAWLGLGPSNKEHELRIWKQLPTEWQALPFAEATHLHNQSALTCFSNGRAHVPPFHGPCRRPLSTREHTTGRPWQQGVQVASSVRCQDPPRGAGQQLPIETHW